MSSKYKRTIDKVTVSDTYKKDLIENLMSPQGRTKKLPLLKLVPLTLIFVISLFWITLKLQAPHNDQIYTLNLTHPYYKSYLYNFDSINEFESLLIDFTLHENAQLITIENAESFIDSKTVYTRYTAKDIETGKQLTFTLLGGTVLFEDWIQDIGLEVEEYNQESYIKVLSDQDFEIELNQIYLITDYNDESMSLYKTRKVDGKIEVYLKEINDWIKLD